MAKEDVLFSPSFGRKPSMLVGREEVIAEFEEGILGLPGNRDRATLIIGQRGFGKTVLLLELAERAKENGFVVSPPVVTDKGMLDHIIENIQFEGSRYYSAKRKLSGGSIGILGISASLSFSEEENKERSFSYKLHRLCEQMEKKDKGILILVDEVQANHAELRQLVITYQELVGAGRNVALVLAGLPGAISATLNDKVLTFLHRAKKVTLGSLSDGDITAFYTDAFAKIGIQLSGLQIAQSVASAEGSPYHMQLIGHYITKCAEDNAISEEAFHRALEIAKKDYVDGVCVAIAESLSDMDQQFVSAMNETGNTGIKEIISRLGITPDLANIYRRRLLDAGVLESPKRGELRSSIPLLVNYLKEGI